MQNLDKLTPMNNIISVSTPKTSVRLALTDPLRDAFDLLKRTRYPFMKEDEILKLALSQLYAGDHIIASQETTISFLLARLRSNNPNFGKDWLIENQIEEQDLDPLRFCDMILALMNPQNTITKRRVTD